jgi:ABC-type multidrug transport system fused ATPase/permease subunit
MAAGKSLAKSVIERLPNGYDQRVDENPGLAKVKAND